MSDPLNDELDASFISPDREFKGAALAPYTEGSRLLLNQVRSDSDTTTFFVWAFIYLHQLIAKDRKQAIKLAWDKDEFRMKVLDFIDGMRDAEREVAFNLVTSIIDEAAKAQVVIIPQQHTPVGND